MLAVLGAGGLVGLAVIAAPGLIKVMGLYGLIPYCAAALWPARLAILSILRLGFRAVDRLGYLSRVPQRQREQP
jgi:hypothetical protein